MIAQGRWLLGDLRGASTSLCAPCPSVASYQGPIRDRKARKDLSLDTCVVSGGVVPRAVAGSDFSLTQAKAGKPGSAKTDRRRQCGPEAPAFEGRITRGHHRHEVTIQVLF